MKIIAAFDFDGTITTKDSFLKFIEFTKGRYFLVINSYYFLSMWILFKLNIFSRHKSKELIFSKCFKGIDFVWFRTKCIEFSSKIDLILNHEVLEKMNKHFVNGDEVVIVSASVKDWIVPWAKNKGVKRVIGTDIEVYNGKLTGRFKSLNCIGQEKVNRLLKAYPNKEGYKLISYGNSSGDNELLEFSDIGHWIKK